MPAVISPSAADVISQEDAAALRCADEMFRMMAVQFPDLRLEQTSEGEIITMAPAFSDTGRRNMEIGRQLANWAIQNGTGITFDSSSGFTMPSGAKRSPDASWIEKARWNALTERQKNDYAPICPDFVVELRSETDRLGTLQKKMREYRTNGAKLGWLIDPRLKRVEIYRTDKEVEILSAASNVSADPELPGFVLELTEIFA